MNLLEFYCREYESNQYSYPLACFRCFHLAYRLIDPVLSGLISMNLNEMNGNSFLKSDLYLRRMEVRYPV